MKIINKYLVLSLAIILTACSGQSGQTYSGKVFDDFGYPLLTKGTLHQVSVVEKNRPFIISGSTDYKIIVNEENNGAYQAANYISNNVNNATGADLKIIENKDFDGLISRQSKYIVIGCNNLFESVGKTMPSSELLEECGYYISSYGNTVFLMAYRSGGYQHSALTFLRQVIGYDMINEDTVIYEKDGSTLPDFEIIESPDFQWQHPTNNFTSTTTYGMGFSTVYSMMVVPAEDTTKAGSTVHNVFTFIDPDIHAVLNPQHPELYHPEWFSDDMTQLCYNAHGDAESRQLMLDTAFNQVKRAVDTHEYQGIINFTDNDNRNCCECEACTAQKAHDGAYSGSVIRFVNELDDRLQAYLEEKAASEHKAKRTVHLQFFAYHRSLQPPTLSVKEDPTLKCNPNVMVMLAPIEAFFMKTFYDEDNTIFAQNVKDWTEYVDNTTAWLYETDYDYYLYPFNTYSSMMINYRFFRELGSTVILNEGQRYNKNVTCFGKLKEYLNSKAQFDVNANYTYYVDKFFKYYFKDAAEIMREYYEEMIGWVSYIESRPEIYGLNGGVRETLGANAENFPKQLLLNWLAKMDEAYKIIEKYKNTDTALYNTLRKHILIETMFPKYALCDLHANTYTDDEILQMRLDFKKDATEIGMVEHMEHYFIDVKYAEWGI